MSCGAICGAECGCGCEFGVPLLRCSGRAAALLCLRCCFGLCQQEVGRVTLAIVPGWSAIVAGCGGSAAGFASAAAAVSACELAVASPACCGRMPSSAGRAGLAPFACIAADDAGAVISERRKRCCTVLTGRGCQRGSTCAGNQRPAFAANRKRLRGTAHGSASCSRGSGWCRNAAAATR